MNLDENTYNKNKPALICRAYLRTGKFLAAVRDYIWPPFPDVPHWKDDPVYGLTHADIDRTIKRLNDFVYRNATEKGIPLSARKSKEYQPRFQERMYSSTRKFISQKLCGIEEKVKQDR